MTREITNRLLEAIEEGLLDRDTVIMACVKYMSEDDVRDMCHANEKLDRGKRFHQRRVRAPEDEHGVRPLGQHRGLDLRKQAAQLLALGAGARLQPVPRPGEPELLGEGGRELRVVVLGRVQGYFVDATFPERERNGGPLVELGPVADDGKDSHAAGECS